MGDIVQREYINENDKYFLSIYLESYRLPY